MRRQRNRSPRVALVYTPSRQMEPHGNRERERRQRQIAKGSLKVTAAKVDDERPKEEVPGPGPEETRPTPESKIVLVAAGGDAAGQ